MDDLGIYRAANELVRQDQVMRSGSLQKSMAMQAMTPI
jgi:hypothetical protein